MCNTGTNKFDISEEYMISCGRHSSTLMNVILRLPVVTSRVL